MSTLGAKDNPFCVMPVDVPYGAWCKCSKCGLIHRSTILFDCYSTGGVGTPLICENSHIGVQWSADAREAFENVVFKEPTNEPQK